MHTPSQTGNDADVYVPAVLRHLPLVPTEARLTATYSPNSSLTRFKYELMWSERAENQDAPPRNPLNAAPHKKQEVDDEDESILSASASASTHSILKKQNGVKCDGPCGLFHQSSQLTQVGRCDHYLCKPCSGIILNVDGSPGCSNWECYREGFYWLPSDMCKKLYTDYVVAQQQSRKRQHPCCRSRCISKKKIDEDVRTAIQINSDRSLARLLSLTKMKSSGSKRSTKEIEVRIMILEKGPNESKRITHTMVNATTSWTLGQVVSHLAADYINRGRLFVVKMDSKEQEESELYLYAPFDQFQDMRLGELPISKSRVLSLTIDLTGQVKPGKNRKD